MKPLRYSIASSCKADQRSATTRSATMRAVATGSLTNKSAPCHFPFGQIFAQVIFLGAFAFFALSTLPIQADDIEYNRDVRPILSDHCFACHGPDSVSRKADLRLDRGDTAHASGVIDAKNLADSKILKRIRSTDPDEKMPPPSTKKHLTDDQLRTLERWITSGAVYEPHWSFKTPQKPAIPEPITNGWARNEIDEFILASMRKHGLTPAPEADLRTLIRRVTLDLTGLPPTLTDIAEVLNDPEPNAYEKYVDRLLARPQWGEHRARFWLDYARYADTHGIHFDNFREMWSYRDWVIQAFNANMPFDQFTIEQLAGDLLPDPTLDQQIATGFNRCNITTNEGGIIDEEYLVLYTRDRTETAAQVFLGLTAGCAVCHDHKFDPLSQREFYELAAFFNNTVQGARDGNRKDTPPIVHVPRPPDRVRYRELAQLIENAKREVAAARDSEQPAFQKWMEQDLRDKLSDSDLDTTEPSLVTHFPLKDGTNHSISFAHQNEIQEIAFEGEAQWSNGHVADKAWTNQKDITPINEKIGDFEHDESFSIALWVKPSKANDNGAVIARMDTQKQYRGWDLWLEGGKIATHIIHRWPENAIKIVSRQPLPKDKFTHIVLAYDGSSKANGVKIFINGKIAEVDVRNNNLTETIRTNVPFRIGSRDKDAPTPGVQLQDLRIYNKALTEAQADHFASAARVRYLLKKSSDKQPASEVTEIFDWYLKKKSESYQLARAHESKLTAEQLEIERLGTVAHVSSERKEAASAYVLYRGQYTERREQVFPKTPSMLPPMADSLPRNRLGFAQWLVDAENPLMARVTVNRFWQEIFGQGLVSTPGDFGISGQLPSHPELLDYLAVSFRENGWNVKDFYRRLVTSATYRQSAAVDTEKLALDPKNQWYSRGPRYRMDAEMVRDYALAASGLLVPRIGGPSVRPYQPPGVWEAVAMPESDTRNYKPDEGQGLYRRSMYTFWKRAAPPASMDIFNAPNRETCAVRRERTNTPLQALVTLNDPQFIEAARQLAQKVLTDAHLNSNEKKIQRLGEILLARQFSEKESQIILGSADRLLSFYHAAPDQAILLLQVGKSSRDQGLSPSDHAAWTMVVNQLMNLDEVLNK